MKNRDVVILKKILDYCTQMREACDMFKIEEGSRTDIKK